MAKTVKNYRLSERTIEALKQLKKLFRNGRKLKS